MNVEIGAEAAQFPEKDYINGIAVAVHGINSFLGSPNRQHIAELWWKASKKASKTGCYLFILEKQEKSVKIINFYIFAHFLQITHCTLREAKVGKRMTGQTDACW